MGQYFVYFGYNTLQFVKLILSLIMGQENSISGVGGGTPRLVMSDTTLDDFMQLFNGTHLAFLEATNSWTWLELILCRSLLG